MAQIKRFENELRKHKRVGIDSSIFIYKFEQNKEFEPLCSVIFTTLSKNKLHLITSAVTASEILVQPFAKKDIEIINLYENLFLTLPNFTLTPIDYKLAKIAAQIRAEDKILLPDAFQIAAAIQEKASMFITNDLKLKKVTDIKILCLKDYT